MKLGLRWAAIRARLLKPIHVPGCSSKKRMDPATAKLWNRILGGAAIILVVAFCIWRIAIEIQVKARLKAIAERGEPANTAQLNASYTAVIADENAALTWLEGCAQLNPKPQREQHSPWSRLRLPSRGMAPDESVLAAATGFVQSNRIALAIFRRAATVSKSRFPIDFAEGSWADRPHLDQLRSAARLLRLEAFAASEAGNADAAVSAILTTLGAARSLMNEPAFLALLTRSAIESMAFAELERLLSCAALTDGQLQELSASFQQNEDPAGLQRALMGERALFSTMANAKQMFSGSNIFADESRFVNAVTFAFIDISGLFRRELPFAMDAFNSVIPLSRLPDPERFLARNQWDRIEDRANRGNYILAGLLLSSFGRSTARDCEQRARARIAITVLAIERFRLKHDRKAPTDLRSLIPAFLPEILSDPFDGQPLRFRPNGDGYLVYSIGADGADNDGAAKISGKARRDQPEDTTLFVARP